MKNEIDVHQALAVVNKITRDGVKKDGVYHFEGLTVESDSDGYTVVLTDGRTSLTLFFHNKYEFDYPDSTAFENFMRRYWAIYGM
ncbi:DUF3081 family protein [uncultured Shewanella sp.]|uniref:DUF3081 family protein n=1 Tax=uncultured Shewanella sp. TaxID=173975 RepID=UPI00260D8698|nr:DUF3081 family protein [uncultured Shewanella sp.]